MRGPSTSSAAATSASAVSLNSIATTLSTNNIKTVEEFLGTLPQSYLIHHTYLWDPLSKQEGSFLAPRAVVFGSDGKLILTFNGDPSQKGYYKIEVAEFDEEASETNFHEIVFDPSEKKNAHLAKDMPECLSCHGEKANYLWDKYIFWPGTYGAARDDVKATFKNVQFTSPGTAYLDLKDYNVRAETAFKNFEDFLKLRPKHSRYKYLEPTTELKGAPHFPYFSLSDAYPWGEDHNASLEPNERLGILVNVLQLKKILRAVEQAKVSPTNIKAAYILMRFAFWNLKYTETYEKPMTGGSDRIPVFGQSCVDSFDRLIGRIAINNLTTYDLLFWTSKNLLAVNAEDYDFEPILFGRDKTNLEARKKINHAAMSFWNYNDGATDLVELFFASLLKSQEDETFLADFGIGAIDSNPYSVFRKTYPAGFLDSFVDFLNAQDLKRYFSPGKFRDSEKCSEILDDIHS